MDTRTSPIRLRITQLREVLARRGVHALLVPSAATRTCREYLPEHWQGRAVADRLHRLDGHAGGHAPTRAALFADSRYWVQAEAELAGTGIELVKIPTGTRPRTSTGWRRRCRAAAPWRWTARCWAWPRRRQLRHALDAAGVLLRTDLDLLDAVWPDRPALPAQPVYEHLAPQRRAPRAAKLAAVREAMARHGATHHFISHRRRRGLDHQPARQRRQLQPGLPGAPAARRHAAHALRRRRQGRRRAGAPSWPPTACSSRPTPRPAPRWPHWATATRC